MKAIFAVSTLLTFISLAVHAQESKEAKGDAKKFAGVWTVDGLTYDGEAHKLKFKITFKGDIGVVEGNDEVQREYARIRFKLDPDAKVKKLDVTVVGGSQTDSKMQGIYEFRDDELRLCVRVFGSERPKDFAAPEGSSTVLIVLKKSAS